MRVREVEGAAVRAEVLLWLIAALAFAFDQYEVIVSPLIARPVLTRLGGLQPGTPSFDAWIGTLFYVPAAVGGVFGLLGGYLTDRFGRLRMMIWSILLYGAATVGAAYAGSLQMFLLFRCLTWSGTCVEFVAATTWLAELYSAPRRRNAVLGYTQAFAAVGGLLSAAAYYLAVVYGDRLPAVRGVHDPWRYVLLPGVLPAIPLLASRRFLIESPVWQLKKAAGVLKRPSPRQLFGAGLRRTTLLTSVLVACSYALAYGAIQHVPRMVPDLVRSRGGGAIDVEKTVSIVQFVQELGAMAGRLLLPMVAVTAVPRRILLQTMLLGALTGFVWLCFGAVRWSVIHTEVAIFAASLAMNCLFSFWGNYLPHLYPTHLRASGESFAMNVGGRIVGTSAALITAALSGVMPGRTVGSALGAAAGTVATVAALIALVASASLAEPAGAELPE